MIKHIVFFKTPEKNKNNIINELVKQLNKLSDTIDEIKHYETGVNVSNSKNAFDVVLVSEFDSLESLEVYRMHEDHQKVVQYIIEKEIETKVVDYKK